MYLITFGSAKVLLKINIDPRSLVQIPTPLGRELPMDIFTFIHIHTHKNPYLSAWEVCYTPVNP